MTDCKQKVQYKSQIVINYCFVYDKSYSKKNDGLDYQFSKEENRIAVSHKIPNMSIKQIAKLQRYRLFIIYPIFIGNIFYRLDFLYFGTKCQYPVTSVHEHPTKDTWIRHLTGSRTSQFALEKIQHKKNTFVSYTQLVILLETIQNE